MEERTITDVPLTLIALPLFNASPTPPALRAGSLGRAGLLQTHAPIAVVRYPTLWELGSARRMAPQAPRKSTANVGVYRQPRQRCALVRSAERASYYFLACRRVGLWPVTFFYNQAAFQKE